VLTRGSAPNFVDFARVGICIGKKKRMGADQHIARMSVSHVIKTTSWMKQNEVAQNHLSKGEGEQPQNIYQGSGELEEISSGN